MTCEGRIKLCIVCSSEDVEGKGDCGPFFSTHRTFSRFCGELELCGDSSRRSDDVDFTGQSSFNAFHFLRSLEKSSKFFRVCSTCLSLITKAVNERAKLESVECQVLQLQIEILTKIKLLQECTDLYFLEMEKVYRRVTSSDVNSLGYWMTRNSEEGGANNQRTNNFHRGRNSRKCDVVLFREKILDVVTSLGIFQDHLNEKLVDNLRNSSSHFQEGDTHHHPPPSNKNKPLINNESLILCPSPPSRGEEFEDGLYSVGMDIVSKCDEDQKTSESQPKPEVVHSIFDKHIKLESNGRGSDSGDDIINYHQSAHKQVKMNEKIINKNMAKAIPKKEKPNPKLALVNFNEMSPAKKLLVKRILNRPYSTADGEDLPEIPNVQQSNLTRSLTKQYKWDYDPQTDKVSLATCEIGVNEDISSNCMTLSCKSCCQFQYSYNFSPSYNKVDTGILILEKHIFNHVLATHLNIFKCDQCPGKDWRTLRKYKEHLDFHKNPCKKYFCETCGKSFKYSLSLQRHREIHLNEQGLQEKKHQCSTCGKGFLQISNLQMHEDIHKPKEKRSQVVCPLCGVTVLKRCYNLHKKYSCPALKDEKRDSVICQVCGKKFNNDRNLGYHIRRTHKIFDSKK